MISDDRIRSRLESVERDFRKRRKQYRVLLVFGVSAFCAGLWEIYNAKIASIELAIQNSSVGGAIIGASSGVAYKELEATLEELERLRVENISLLDRIESLLDRIESFSMLNGPIDEDKELELARSHLVALQYVQVLRQQTIYVGDQVSFAVDGTLVTPDEVPGPKMGFQCAEMGGPMDLREALMAKPPIGYRLVRLDLIVARAGGICGHKYYSATFASAVY